MLGTRLFRFVLSILVVMCGGLSGCADDVACCPIDSAPSHDCFATGGSGACRELCDANPTAFVKVEDANGCPMWRFR